MPLPLRLGLQLSLAQALPLLLPLGLPLPEAEAGRWLPVPSTVPVEQGVRLGLEEALPEPEEELLGSTVCVGEEGAE